VRKVRAVPLLDVPEPVQHLAKALRRVEADREVIHPRHACRSLRRADALPGIEAQAVREAAAGTEVFDFALDDAQMATLDALDEGLTTDWDPAWQA